MLGVPKDCLREARTLRAIDRGKSTRRRHVPSLIDKEVITSRCHGNKTKKTKKMTCIQSFLCMIELRSKTVAHTFFSINSTVQMAVSVKIQKFCYHNNLTSHLSSLL